MKNDCLKIKAWFHIMHYRTLLTDTTTIIRPTTTTTTTITTTTITTNSMAYGRGGQAP